LVETEPGFDADHQQIECVGQREPDAMLPLSCDPSKYHRRKQIPETADAQAQQKAQSKQGRCGRQKEEQRGGQPDAEKPGQRLVATVSSRYEPLLELSHLPDGARRPSADPLHRGEETLRNLARVVERPML